MRDIADRRTTTTPLPTDYMALTRLGQGTESQLKCLISDLALGAAGGTAGTVTASSPVVVDANKHIDTIGISASGLLIGASGSETAVTATGAELNKVAGVTAGTVIASKAIVTDSGIKITGLLQCTYGAGTATVAPVIYTSGTNLTTAAAGAVEFDGKAFYMTAVASSRQVIPAEQFICSSANSATFNNTGLDTNVAAQVFDSTGAGTTNGAVTLAASTSYWFEGQYILSNTGTTSHTWATLFGLSGGASVTSIGYTATGRTGATSAVTATADLSLYIAVATQVPVTAASTSATEFVIVKLKGVIRMNAGGVVTPQMQASARPGASGTPGVVILAGSYIRFTPIGSNTVASVGNWS